MADQKSVSIILTEWRDACADSGINPHRASDRFVLGSSYGPDSQLKPEPIDFDDRSALLANTF